MKRLLLTLFCALALSTIGAWGDSYTITFKTGSNTNQISSSTKVSTIVDANSTKYVSSFTDFDKAIYGTTKALQLGNSKTVGKITINVAASYQINATKITIKAQKYDKDASLNISVNSGKESSTGTLTATEQEYTFDLNGTPIKTIALAGITERVCISSITILSGPTEVKDLTFSPLSVDYGDIAKLSVNPTDFAAGVTELTLTPETDGIVTFDGLTYMAEKAGTTKVNVFWKNGEKYLAGDTSFEFTVNTLKPKLSWSADNVVCEQGENVTLPNLSNTIASLKPVVTSTNTAVAVVADDGTVSLAGGIGEAEITATIAAVEGENEAATASYTISVTEKGVLAAPVFDPNGGTFALDDATFEITAKAGQIYYGEGTTKADATELYDGGFVIETVGDHTYVAYAVDGERESEIATATFTITKNVPEFGYAVETATVALGSDDVLPMLNNPKNLAYTLTSSNPEVVALSPVGDGTLWVLAEGTTTITAKFAGDDSTEAATASYTLTVGPAKPAVETKTATFDFTKAGAYGMVAQSGSSTIYNETEAKPSFSFNDGGDLSITTNKVGGKASRLWTNSDNTKFEWRVMNGATFTITAPENGAINSVVFVKGNVTSSARFNIKHKDGNTETSLTNMTWSATEPVNGITFISSGDRSDIASITVTYTKPGAPSAKSAGLSFSDVEREVLVGEITPVEGVSVDADAAALVGYKILDASGNEVESADVEPSTDAAGMVDILADELGEYTLMAYVAPGQGFIPAIAKTIVSVRETICPVALYMHGHFGNRYYKLDEPVVMQKNGKIFTASGILIGGNKDVTDGDLGYVFTTHLPQSTVSRAAHDSDWSQLTEGNVYHAGGVAKAVDINSQDDLTPYTVDKEGLYDITADFSDPAAPDFNAEYIDTTTGIEGVSVSENGVVEYFDLTGRRVENPSAGVYIRRTGSEIQKIMLR